MLARALEIAYEAHKGGKCAYGEEYILHPLRVMSGAMGQDERIVAILHDVVEDTTVTLKQLVEEGFSEEVIKAIDLLTHRDEHTYDEYIQRIATSRSAIAVRIKILDLMDNINPLRLPEIGEREVARIKKYHKAYQRLKDL